MPAAGSSFGSAWTARTPRTGLAFAFLQWVPPSFFQKNLQFSEAESTVARSADGPLTGARRDQVRASHGPYPTISEAYERFDEGAREETCVSGQRL